MQTGILRIWNNSKENECGDILLEKSQAAIYSVIMLFLKFTKLQPSLENPFRKSPTEQLLETNLVGASSDTLSRADLMQRIT